MNVLIFLAALLYTNFSLAAKPVGYIYNATVSTQDARMIAEELKYVIFSLNGLKIDNAPLGSEVGGSFYFHFSLPKKNQKELVFRLKEYGPVKLDRNDHKTIMPKDKIRMILWVQERY